MKPRECPEQKLRQLAVWLRERHESWRELHERGGFSPDPDGIRLNQLRRQILLLKHDICVLCHGYDLELPDVAYESVPPFVPDFYSVKAIDSYSVAYECVADRNKPKQLSLF